ncbi:TnsA endonuclease N-terminal domain-containing protein [Burkholderiaceae bacterium DAT-1]|nr:TnsA endonuclease N-terminal domain-containing protein [Burkholderiaceae bacterium DAT-1]
MPVRRVPKNYRNVTGIAAHTKAEGQAMYESTLERDFITLLEFNPAVLAFEVQPLTINWIDSQGTSRSYTPDVLARFRQTDDETNTVLYEVKYRNDLKKDWPILKPKFKAAIKRARQHRWRFKIVTEQEIRSPYLDNATFLLPFIRRTPPTPEVISQLLGHLDLVTQSSPQELLHACSQDEWQQAYLIPALWHLIGTRQICADLTEKLTMTSKIWSAQHGNP